MELEASTERWIDLLGALRAEHLARLNRFGRQIAAGALALAIALVLAVVLGLDPLWDVSFEDLPLAGALALGAAAAFAAACALFALAQHQQRRDRSAAIAHLDRALAELVAGAAPHAVLGELSERMRRLAPPRHEVGSAPYLPSLLDARWLGTRLHRKVSLGCALLLLAAVLIASALVLAAPPVSDYDDDAGTPTAGSAPPGDVIQPT